MQQIKKDIKDVTFIGFVTKGKEEFVKVMVKNETGGKDTVVFKILTNSREMRGNEWQHILTTIKNKTYLEIEN